MSVVAVLTANVGLMGEMVDYKAMVGKFVELVARRLQTVDVLLVCLQEFAHLRSPLPVIHEGCVAALEAELSALASRVAVCFSGLVFSLGRDIGREYSGLCSLFFARASAAVHVRDRHTHKWHSVEEVAAHSTPDRHDRFAHGERFPPAVNPSDGRKGYLEMVLRFADGFEVSFTNIHLPADNDNLEAVKQSPSQYHNWRRSCWQYTLERVAHVPGRGLVLAGDINVRLDLAAMMDSLRREGDTVTERQVFTVLYVRVVVAFLTLLT